MELCCFLRPCKGALPTSTPAPAGEAQIFPGITDKSNQCVAEKLMGNTKKSVVPNLLEPGKASAVNYVRLVNRFFNFFFSVMFREFHSRRTRKIFMAAIKTVFGSSLVSLISFSGSSESPTSPLKSDHNQFTILLFKSYGLSDPSVGLFYFVLGLLCGT